MIIPDIKGSGRQKKAKVEVFSTLAGFLFVIANR